MNRNSRIFLVLALLVTAASLVTWIGTGGDWYTKFEVVEQVEVEPAADDPLVAAGFYDGNTVTRTVTRDEFRLGLLPIPTGLLDKHALSVATLAGPFWGLALVAVWLGKRRRRGRQAAS